MDWYRPDVGSSVLSDSFSSLYGYELQVIAYDFGIKHNILKRLASYGCKITVVPSTWPASETLKMKPDGVLFSNGPGDPSAVPYAVETVKEIIGRVPAFGICMGHQLLGLALGGKTFKMKFGHHGGNHPVRNLRSGHVEISAQVCMSYKFLTFDDIECGSFEVFLCLINLKEMN